MFCDGRILYVRADDDANVCYAAAHEIRHIWQIRNMPQLLAPCDDDMEYTESMSYDTKAEIDAHAFAMMTVKKFLKLELLPQAMSKDIKKQIVKIAQAMELAI